MMGSMIGQIELTAAEQKLVDQVVLDHAGSVRLDYEETIANGELAAALVKSLLARKAIPESRLRYFADREYNIGNPKASIRELFLRASRTDEVMYRHPNFLKYLHYFVFGSDLPASVKEAFLARFKESDGDRKQLVQLGRNQYRELIRARSPQDYRLPDAFYQLALDCGCDQWDARSVRDAVKRVK
jgi:hypothetical protein